jgi:hypothetical protein
MIEELADALSHAARSFLLVIRAFRETVLGYAFVLASVSAADVVQSL